MNATVFGKYELLERIAIGGMAEIFLARSASLGGVTRTCVIKRILPEYSADRQFVSMFIDEARITIGLDHPNIVKLFDFGQVDGVYFMAMELVDGVDLVDLLRHSKRHGLDTCPRAAAYIGRCMALALHHAHVQKDYRGVPLGIVHRDVSPHNVFLSWLGDVKVGDFGIAAARNKLTVTQAGTVKGKFAYMSPEQATGGIIDQRADVWAVGVVLHELVTGSRLFAAESPIVTIGRVVEQRVPRPSEKHPEVPPALDDIIMQALVRPLDKRYPTAAALAEDLDGFLAKGGGYERQHFGSYLASLEWEVNTVTQPALSAPSAPSSEAMPSAVHRARDVHDDKQLRELIDSLGRAPDLWTLVRIGERHEALGEVQSALSAYRTASAVFAHRGMLIQAMCAFHGARALLSGDEVTRDLTELGALRDQPKAGLVSHLRRVDKDGYWALLQALDKDGLGAEDAGETLFKHPSPLFGRLPAADFAKLAAACKVRRVSVGQLVLREGEGGASLFGVGKGRLVVHCLPGNAAGSFAFPGEEIPGAREILERTLSESGDDPGKSRIYLSALADGDVFGEFSFLTGRPRSATVETITECLLLEIDHDTAENLLRTDPAFKEPLLEFYKERVGELMMAKNPVFAILSPEDRRELLSRSQLRRFRDEEAIVSEGEVSEDMFFIKHGEVEVFREDAGLPVFINKLREGEFFGEMAALHGTPRSASVRAMGDVELFRIRRSDLDDILAREDRLREIFEAAIQWRAAETQARLAESRRIFEGV